MGTDGGFALRRSYENLVQVRLLLEDLATPQDILDHWHQLLPKYMAKWQLDRADVCPTNPPASVLCR